MRVVAPLCAIIMAVSLPAMGAERIFKGSGIDIPRAFTCGGATRPAGRYTLDVQYDPKPKDRSVLTVLDGDKPLCEVSGTSNRGNLMETAKVRVFTRVNTEMESVQVEVIVPSAARTRVPNQVFYLPLATGH